MDITVSLGGLLTGDEAAELLGTSKHYIYKLVYQQKLQPARFLGRILFRRDELERYAREHPGLGSQALTLAVA